MVSGAADPIDALLRSIVERWEGGFVNHPDDRGGPTKYGITAAVLAEARGVAAVGAAEVQRLELGEALAIYRERYVREPGFDRIADEGVRAYAIDYAINSGCSRAIRHLQAAAGVIQDGVLGPRTLAAIAADPRGVLQRLTRRLLLFLAGIVEARRDQAVFLEGWITRATAWLMAAERAA